MAIGDPHDVTRWRLLAQVGAVPIDFSEPREYIVEAREQSWEIPTGVFAAGGVLGVTEDDRERFRAAINRELALIGERGPEIVRVPTGATVLTPHFPLRRAAFPARALGAGIMSDRDVMALGEPGGDR